MFNSRRVHVSLDDLVNIKNHKSHSTLKWEEKMVRDAISDQFENGTVTSASKE